MNGDAMRNALSKTMALAEIKRKELKSKTPRQESHWECKLNRKTAKSPESNAELNASIEIVI